MKPTVSPLPGTTLNIISVPLKKGGLLFDTPGILSKNQLINFLTPSEVKVVLPKKKLKSKVFLMYPGKTLFFGGVGRFDYVEGPRMFFTGNYINIVFV
jgi:ribosome biogenesis GTPase A